MRCTRCQSFACGPCELRLPAAGLRITLGIWRTWSGFLPSLSEPRPCGRPLLGNRLTPVSCCFSFSFMIHGPGCIFSFYLFGSKKWVGRKNKEKPVSRWREGWQFGNNKQTRHSANSQKAHGGSTLGWVLGLEDFSRLSFHTLSNSSLASFFVH